MTDPQTLFNSMPRAALYNLLVNHAQVQGRGARASHTLEIKVQVLQLKMPPFLSNRNSGIFGNQCATRREKEMKNFRIARLVLWTCDANPADEAQRPVMCAETNPYFSWPEESSYVSRSCLTKWAEGLRWRPEEACVSNHVTWVELLVSFRLLLLEHPTQGDL